MLSVVIIGAVIGTASYVIAAIVSGDYGSINLSGVLKSAFWGAVSGAVTFGIGSCFTAAATATNSVVASGMQNARFLLQAAVHGVAQGTLAMVQSGGSGFFSGATAGFFGSMGATAWSAGVGGKFASSGVGTIAFGALSGGVGAEMTGGNFWQGAVTGGIVAGLNHVMHQTDSFNAEEGDDDPKHKPKSKTKSNIKKGKGGQAVGFGGNAAVGGGIGVEFGIVTDDNGGRAFYFTFKGNVGVGGDVGISVNIISPTHNGTFSVNDYAGTGNSHSASIGAWGYERGGTMNKVGIEKIYFNNTGSGKRGYIVNGGSRSYVTPMTKGGLGYMFTESKTWTFNF